MIGIGRYNNVLEDAYWECVNKNVSEEDQNAILCSCVKFLPTDFFAAEANFKELILAPYSKLKDAYAYMKEHGKIMKSECFQGNASGKLKRKVLYQKLYDAYWKVSRNMVNEIKMNVKLVRETGVTVCPYCNRNYINSRLGGISGARLDHFYPRSEYPIFSVSLYNLVPVCGNCNRVKSDKFGELASPFDETIDWENNIRFTYAPLDTDQKKIIIDAEGPIKNNVKAMHIDTAYQIHSIEVNELLEKVEMYNDSQFEEFRKVLGEAGLTELEMKHMVFGPEITTERMKTKPLGRMMRDLERELGVYE